MCTLIEPHMMVHAVPTWASRKGNTVDDTTKREILDEAKKVLEREELKVLQEVAREVATAEQQPLKNLKACANPGENCAFIDCCEISGHNIDCLGNRCYDWNDRPYPPIDIYLSNN
uniref:Uncharacterized protein n=1 Tax=Chenopodium quinoa TaxID=63459 RepID=A0A803KP53_CHEQI